MRKPTASVPVVPTASVAAVPKPAVSKVPAVPKVLLAVRALPALLATAVLAGCAPIVPLTPAEGATDPACASVIVRLPDTVSGLDSRQTNAQATAAWGTPASVILRCGLEPPAPTSLLRCYTVSGVDWLVDDSDDPDFVFTTYGRVPAVQVVIDSDGDPAVEGDGVSGAAVLGDLSYAVSQLPAEGECIDPQDIER